MAIPADRRFNSLRSQLVLVEIASFCHSQLLGTQLNLKLQDQGCILATREQHLHGNSLKTRKTRA